MKQNCMDKYRCKDTEVKKCIWQEKRKWVDYLAMEAEEAARVGKIKKCMILQKPSVMINTRQQIQ